VKFEDIIASEEILDHLRWDMTPERYMAPRKVTGDEDLTRYVQELREQAGYYFYVDVWNCQAHLALMHVKEDGSGWPELVNVDDELAGEVEKLIHGAVEIAGGAVNIGGHYPLSPMLTRFLKNDLILGRKRARDRKSIREKRAENKK